MLRDTDTGEKETVRVVVRHRSDRVGGHVRRCSKPWMRSVELVAKDEAKGLHLEKRVGTVGLAKAYE